MGSLRAGRTSQGTKHVTSMSGKPSPEPEAWIRHSDQQAVRQSHSFL